ncbi:MAG: phage tail tip lysozyme, partial [Succinivibrionaceae bacterium]
MNQFGMNGNMNNAVNYALKGGFKEINGGTYPEYFDSYLGQSGIKTQNLNDNADVVNSLINGKPVIMMGQDQSDSGNTPYGSQYSHYVVATGLDQNGDVIVEDSEDPNGSTRYNLQDTLNNTSLKIGTAMGRGKVRYGRAKESVLSRYTKSMANAMYQPYLKFVSQFIDVDNNDNKNNKKAINTTSVSVSPASTNLSASTTFTGDGTLGSVGDMDTNAKMIWRWFRAQGFSKEACAAILGNMQQESSIQPKAPSKSYNDPNDVTDGIIQWDPFSQHRKWCDSNGISDYYDLGGQLKHVLDSINSKWKSNYSHDGYAYLSKTDFINATDVASATVAFERCVEISGDWRSNRDSKRIKYAQEWFNKLSASDGASGLGNDKKLFSKNKPKYGKASETTNTSETASTNTINTSEVETASNNTNTVSTQQAKNEGTAQISYGGISDLLKGYMAALFPQTQVIQQQTATNSSSSTVANATYSGDGTVIEGDFETNRASCWRFLRANGFSPAAAAGCIGNFVQECGLIRKNIHVRESNKNNGGIIGWTPFTKHENWCAKNGVSNPESLESQLKHIVWSVDANDWDNTQYVGLKGAKKVNSAAEFKALTDIPTATMSIERNIILWGDWSTSDPGNSRIKYAQDAYNAYCNNDGNISGTGRGKKSAKQLLKEKAKFYENINKKLAKRPSPSKEEIKKANKARKNSNFIHGIAEDGDDYIISAYGRANEERGGRYAATEDVKTSTPTGSTVTSKPSVADKDYSNAFAELEEKIADKDKGLLLNSNVVKDIVQAKNEGNANTTYGGTSDLLNGYTAALFPNLVEVSSTSTIGTTGSAMTVTGSIDEASLGIQDSFMSKRSGSKRSTTTSIVVHYWGDESGNATAAGIKKYWESIGCSVYANYIIGPDGDVIRCCPEEESAPCSNTVNNHTISIENAHYDESKKWQIKEKTYDKLVRMCAYLCLKYNLDPLNGGIMRHYDVKCSKYPNGKGCPPWFIACTDKTDTEAGTDDANNTNYNTFKNAVAALMKQNSTSAVGRGRANAMAHKKKNTKLFHGGIAEDGDDTGKARKKRPIRNISGRSNAVPKEEENTNSSTTNTTNTNLANNKTQTNTSVTDTTNNANNNNGSVTIGDSASLMSKLGSYIGNSVKQTYGAYYYTIFGDENSSGSTSNSDKENTTATANTINSSTGATSNNAIGINNTISAAIQVFYKMGNVPYSHDNSRYTIDLNGQTIKVRPDCSGYMSAVIYAMGYSIVNSSGNKTHAIVAKEFASEGCVSKYIRNADGSPTSDWIDMPFSKEALQPGDIIAYSAHTEMYWYTDSNGKLRGFSGGSIEKSYNSAKAYVENGVVSNDVYIVSCHTRILRFVKNSGIPAGGTGRGKVILKKIKNKFNSTLSGRSNAAPKEEENTNSSTTNTTNTNLANNKTQTNTSVTDTTNNANNNNGSVTIGDSASLMSKLGSYIGNSVKQTYGAYYYTIFGDESSSGTASNTTSTTASNSSTNNSTASSNMSSYNPNAKIIAPFKGYFYISSMYDPQGKWSKTRGGSHGGIDIIACDENHNKHMNAPIYSLCAGTAVKAGWEDASHPKKGFGQYVCVQDANGDKWYYGHMSSITVSQGQQVSVGTQLGCMGTTGSSSGDHLHFEIRIGGSSSNTKDVAAFMNVPPKFDDSNPT